MPSGVPIGFRDQADIQKKDIIQSLFALVVHNWKAIYIYI